jgi:hypothetical protein
MRRFLAESLRSGALRVLVGMTLFAIVSNCSTMLDTHVLDPAAPMTCTNAAGAYFLPKKLIKVQVTGDIKTAGKNGLGLDVGDVPISAPDRSVVYCLDYLASPTSRDEVGIIRNPEGLLQRVYTRAEDKSVDIAKTLVDTSFLLTGAALREGVGITQPSAIVGDYEFDPFEPVEAARINAALRQFGYCVFVEGYSFPFGLSPQSWCEQPRVISVHVARADVAEPLPAAEMSRRGVLYRPNVTRTLTVLRKANPTGRGPWLLAMTRQIEVPNGAPAFVAEVNRSLFVDRVTDLEFSDGVLTNISVKKPSEIAAFVEIPLAIANAVAALPGLVVKLKINDANNRQRLINAQSELIAVRRQHNDALAALLQKSGGNSLTGIQEAPGRSGGPSATNDPKAKAIVIDNCLATGRPADVCEQQWLDISR